MADWALVSLPLRGRTRLRAADLLCRCTFEAAPSPPGVLPEPALE